MEEKKDYGPKRGVIDGIKIIKTKKGSNFINAVELKRITNLRKLLGIDVFEQRSGNMRFCMFLLCFLQNLYCLHFRANNSNNNSEYL